MRLERLSTWMLCFTLVAPLGACDDDDGGDDSAGDSANNDSGAGMTSSSEETCMSSHVCVNDACTCQTPGLVDAPCTDDEQCEDECEVCG